MEKSKDIGLAFIGLENGNNSPPRKSYGKSYIYMVNSRYFFDYSNKKIYIWRTHGK